MLPGTLLELVVKRTFPVLAPPVAGRKRTLTTQLAPAASVVAQFPTKTVILVNPVPVTAIATFIAIVPVPVLLRVTSLVGALAAAIAVWTFPKSTLAGPILAMGNCTTPSPDSATVCVVLLDPSSVIVSVPLFRPALGGLKRTVIVQLAPAATLPAGFGQVPPALVNPEPAVTAMLETANAALPGLVVVAVCPAELVPTFCLANVSDDGVAFAIGAAPVPVTATFNGAELLLTAIVPVTAPTAVGANRTLTVQDAPRGKVVVAPQVPPVVMENAGLLPVRNDARPLRTSGRRPAFDTVRGTVETAPTLTFPNASGDTAKAVGATARSWKALQALVTASLPAQNRRFSMFHSVSFSPSPFG